MVRREEPGGWRAGAQLQPVVERAARLSHGRQRCEPRAPCACLRCYDASCNEDADARLRLR